MDVEPLTVTVVWRGAERQFAARYQDDRDIPFRSTRAQRSHRVVRLVPEEREGWRFEEAIGGRWHAFGPND